MQSNTNSSGNRKKINFFIGFNLSDLNFGFTSPQTNPSGNSTNSANIPQATSQSK